MRHSQPITRLDQQLGDFYIELGTTIDINAEYAKIWYE